MARTLRAKIQTFIIMKMNRCLVLVLPLLFVMSSCGTTAQFAQQRFQDGIYSRPEPVAEAVQIYSKDDFAAMAAANIAREDNQKDTVYVVVRDEYSWYDSPWFAWGSAWAFSWPYRYWWNDPWYYGWGPYWRSPWYYSWYWDPWYYAVHGTTAPGTGARTTTTGMTTIIGAGPACPLTEGIITDRGS